LAEACTEEYTKWVGVLVDLYDEETAMGKGVRLRPVKSTANGAATKDMNDSIQF
jgi:hypothetical protein